MPKRSKSGGLAKRADAAAREQRSKAQAAADAVPEEERVDAFHRERTRRMARDIQTSHGVAGARSLRAGALSASKAAGLGANSDGSDEDDEEYDDDDHIEEVLGLPSDDDEDDEEDDDEDEEAYEDDDDDDDDDESDAQEDDDEEASWGKRRGNYYGGAEDAKSGKATPSKGRAKSQAQLREEEFAARELEQNEEAEARKIQRKQMASLTADDFGDMSSSDDDDDNSDNDDDAVTAAAKNSNSSTKKERDGERITRDLAALSSDERLEILMRDSPEMLELVGQFRAHVDELQMTLQPLMKRVASGELATRSGMGFLEMRYHLLLSYCLNIAFYLMLKCEGRSVRDHPVIERLVQLRTVMERIRPLERKLQYQVDKLMRSADESAQGAQSDLSHRANVSRLLDDDNEKKEEKDEGKAKETKRVKQTKQKGAEEAGEEGDSDSETVRRYSAPKQTAVYFDGDDTREAKRERQMEKKKRKAMRSSMFDEIQEEFSERPREIADVTGMGRELGKNKVEKEWREREKYEEEHFLRLTMTKKDKKKAVERQRELMNDGMRELTDFGDLRGLDGGGGYDEEGKPVRATLRAAIGEMGRKKEGKRSKRGRDEVEEGGDETNTIDMKKRKHSSEADAFYDSVRSQKQLRKAELEQADRQREMEELGMDQGDAEGKRAISKQIQQNRGLTPKRNKEKKNPRVKHRLSFKKALIKRNSTVKTHKPELTKYSGEATGIRTTISRSVRMK